MPYRFTSPTHSCILETHTCEWKGGCRRKVAIGLPLCWQHSRLEYGVKVAPSTIKGGGKGLFATKEFEKGKRICPYGGRLLTRAELDRLYPGKHLAPYAENVSKEYVRDAACVRGIGSMANGVPRKKESNAETYVSTNRAPWLRATKRIKEGEEILNHYGPEYFEDPDIHTSKTRYVRKSKN